VAVAIAEMALAGNIGVHWFEEPHGVTARVFGEDQGRFIITVADGSALLERANAAGVPAQWLGTTGDDRWIFGDANAPEQYWKSVSLTDLRAANESFFSKLMGSELTPEF
jgi:phosphoribosylformylglycinamidine synthase